MTAGNKFIGQGQLTGSGSFSVVPPPPSSFFIAWPNYGPGFGYPSNYLYTTNGTSFTSYSMPESNAWWNSAYVNGMFFNASYSGHTYYSTDGINWTQGGNISAGAGYTNGIAYGNGVYVCANSFQSSYSTNGTSWSAIEGFSLGQYPNVVAYGNGKFVGVGSHIYTSTNGSSWTQSGNYDFSLDQLSSIIYANNMFVASNGTYFYTSSDGIIWTQVSSSPDFGTRDLQFNNGVYTVNAGISLYHSTDLTNWTLAISNIECYSYANGVYLVNTGFGGSSFSHSSDLINWTAVDSNVSNYYGSIVNP